MKSNLKNVEINKCIICKKKYFKNIKSRHGRDYHKKVRPANATKTCSAKCSKEYNKIQTSKSQSDNKARVEK